MRKHALACSGGIEAAKNEWPSPGFCKSGGLPKHLRKVCKVRGRHSTFARCNADFAAGEAIRLDESR